MFEDNAPAAKKAGNLKHIKATTVDLSRDHHHRGYSDSNNIVTKTCKAAPVPMQDQQQHATDDQKNQQQLDQECTHCEDPSLYQSQVNSMSVVQDSDQSSSFPHNHREDLQ
jgi:superoxide dismutase